MNDRLTPVHLCVRAKRVDGGCGRVDLSVGAHHYNVQLLQKKKNRKIFLVILGNLCSCTWSFYYLYETAFVLYLSDIQVLSTLNGIGIFVANA